MGKQGICEAPLCDAVILSGRRYISGKLICRACYQFVWGLSKKLAISLKDAFTQADFKRARQIDATNAICARPNCEVKLAEVEGQNRRRLSLDKPLLVCHACYQSAWELSNKFGVTMEKAWDLLPPKGYSKETKPVQCSLPWCEIQIKPTPKCKFGEGLYACGRCRSYLNVLARRYEHKGQNWKEWGRMALEGKVLPPDSPETCALSWCNKTGKMNSRGPKGEPICYTDSMYLRVYAIRCGISVDEAFNQAPPPRLLHTRSQTA